MDIVFFSHWLIMRSRNWADLRSPTRKIRDIQIVGTYDHITFSEFQKVRSSPAALAQRQRRKKVTWRRVIPSDLVTWPWTVGGHCLQTPREIDGWLMDATHFFPYSWKISGGGGTCWYQTPFGARFNPRPDGGLSHLRHGVCVWGGGVKMTTPPNSKTMRYRIGRHGK